MRSFSIFFVTLLVITAFSGWGARGEYTLERAMTALLFSRASYCETGNINDWSCEACRRLPSFQHKSILRDEYYDSQAFVGVHNGSIVVSFRGTSSLSNWLSNIDASVQDYPNTACVGCSVHRGFLGVYNSLRDQMWNNIRELVQAHPTYPILVTGHSLGGALATFAATDIIAQSNITSSPVTLYTFGSPRVGNKAFAEWVANLFCRGSHELYRVVSVRDPVPHVPPMFREFAHVPLEIFYDTYNNAAFKKCENVKGDTCGDLTLQEDPTCSNSYYITFGTGDHLMYLGGCTSCSCISTRSGEMEDAYELPEHIRKWIIDDYEFIHNQSFSKK